MPVMQTMIDDADVGRGLGEYFKPSTNKQRFAILPYSISEASLIISDELRAKAATDVASANILEHRLRFAELLKEGCEGEPARVIKTEQNGVPGYRYSRTDSALVHYDTTVKYFLCKADQYQALGREAECCKKAKVDAVAQGRKAEQGNAQKLYAFVLLVYQTDTEGNVLKLAPDARKTLDEKYKLDFKYEIKTWAINDTKMKSLKQYTNRFPLINCDYEVWTQKRGAADITMFSPCAPPAMWMSRGPVLEKKVMDEAEAIWGTVPRTLGKDLTVEELDRMCLGVSSSPPKAKTEKNFSGLLG